MHPEVWKIPNLMAEYHEPISNLRIFDDEIVHRQIVAGYGSESIILHPGIPDMDVFDSNLIGESAYYVF